MHTIIIKELYSEFSSKKRKMSYDNRIDNYIIRKDIFCFVISKSLGKDLVVNHPGLFFEYFVSEDK